MIADSNEMKKIEAGSGYSSRELMEMVGKKIAEEIMHAYSPDKKILFLCGKGNNGGDGFVCAKYLKDYDYGIILCEGKPKTEEAMEAYSALKKKKIHPLKDAQKYIFEADLIVDAVYGFSYHGTLNAEIKTLFGVINQAKLPVWSIDINSGAESDSGYYDRDAIHSKITFAIECMKPFHALKKEHQLFEDCKIISLGLKHNITAHYHEMNEEAFFSYFPHKKENAYKGSYGKTLLVGGGYGAAGALSLNILGAKTVGAGYINVACPDEIYHIVGSQHITPVFHPFGHATWEETLTPLVHEAKAIAFGSGAAKLSRKSECMDKILQESKGPVVLDAEALRLLVHNTWILRFIQCPVVLTPHLGEFAALINQPVEMIQHHKIEYAKAFALKHKVCLVLKGPNTVVVSPKGEIYINQSGNQALAQAGSGDLLTGILAGILTIRDDDIFTSVCMGVWLHGYLAEVGSEVHSMQNFPITEYPMLMDKVFKNHGF